MVLEHRPLLNQQERVWRLDWLERLLVFATATLILQHYPAAWDEAVRASDFRRWSQATWFGLNIFALAIVLVWRFGPELRSTWAASRAEKTAKQQREFEIQKRKERRLQAEEMRRRGKNGIDFY
jgi:hypothetical protein